ncbi:MAG TPA: hypothetical protein VF678_14955 [bacterium]
MEFWNGKKQLVLGIVIGALLGPLVSGLAGWQVSSAFHTRTLHAAVVREQAVFCEARARAAVKNLDKMEFSDRYNVAEKYAKLPGMTEADGDVVSACSDGLAG